MTADVTQNIMSGKHNHYERVLINVLHIMMSSNGNIFRVTSHLCGENTGHRWIPRKKASDGELWCFPWSAAE